MNQQASTLDDLILRATDYIRFKSTYSQCTIQRYTSNWKKLKYRMELSGIKNFSIDIGNNILNDLFKDRTKRELSHSELYFYNGIQKLTEFQQTSKIEVHHRPICPLTFKGPIGDVIEQFLEYKVTVDRISSRSFRTHKRNLFELLTYFNDRKLHSLSEINLAFVHNFICSRDSSKSSIIPSHFQTLRGFIKYAHEKSYLQVDFSNKIPKYKSVKQPKLPSVYTTEEIQKLIASIERSSFLGKRNYAIILIAARLGLRAIDIARLQFDNLHWETSSVKLTQSKTRKELQLPLLPDVGNSIIDYLKYARPTSQEPFIFLTGKPPYCSFPDSAAITKIVQRAFIKAGINVKDRKFGAHSLRHTLGFRMLEKSTILPVISQVLGHQSSESTKFYLRIDLKSMRECVLDVPAVPKEFYVQKGGLFL